MIHSTMSEAGGTFAGRKNEGLAALKNFFSSIFIYRSFRILLSAIFLWSGISKLMDPNYFAFIIDGYGLLTDPLTMPAAIVFSIIEVLAGLGLLADIRGSLAVVTGLLASFMVILSYGVWLGLDIDCGCFGSEDPEIGAFSGLRTTLFRDIVMMLVIFYLYFWRHLHGMTPKSLTNLVRSFKKKEA